MIKALIIDDESDSLKLLADELQEHCPQVTVVGKYSDSEEGLKAIHALKPNLVFMDIEMPRMNGFEILQHIGGIDFSLIFVTAYDAFAVKAFKFSALDYLLKPVHTPELIAAIRKVEKQQTVDLQQLNLLRVQYQSGQHPQKLAIPHLGKVIFLSLEDIIYCEADGNYSKLYLSDKRTFVLTKTLRDLQGFLEEKNFIRVHRQYLINLDHICEYVRGEGNYLVMSNGVSIPVARNQKDRLMGRFGWL
jgi:two-component system, LytTR family, response regulator